jgi:hypothetical protein
VILTAEAACLEEGRVLSTGSFADGSLSMVIPAAPSGCQFMRFQLVANGENLSEPAEIRVEPLRFSALH